MPPIITENSMASDCSTRSTPLRLLKTANKMEIAKAVEALFPGTKVAKVNTMNCDGKLKRMGRYEGRTARLQKGDRYPDRGFQDHRVL